MMAEDEDATLNPDDAEALFEEVDEADEAEDTEAGEDDEYDEFGNLRV